MIAICVRRQGSAAIYRIDDRDEVICEQLIADKPHTQTGNRFRTRVTRLDERGRPMGRCFTYPTSSYEVAVSKAFNYDDMAFQYEC